MKKYYKSFFNELKKRIEKEIMKNRKKVLNKKENGWKVSNKKN